jgi:hypothetical protein
MLGLKDTWVIRYSGDEEAGKAHAPFALKQAGILKEFASHQNLVVASLPREYDDFKLVVNKVGDHYDIIIHVDVVSVVEVEEAIIEDAPAVHILLTNYISARAYDYFTDGLYMSVISSDNVSDAELNPHYNGRSQLSDETHITISDGVWTSGIIGNAYVYLGGVNAYEMAMFVDGDAVYGRVGSVIGRIAIMQDTLLSQFCAAYGTLFALPTYKPGITWNQYRGLIGLTLNVANQQILDSWYWTPSFFTVHPGEGLQRPGWYYGTKPNGQYDTAVPLSEATVRFKGLLDTRYRGNGDQYGWCEYVTSINNEEKNDLYFYLSAEILKAPVNNTSYHEGRYGSYTADIITIGSDLTGFDLSFAITPAIDDPEVSLWNFSAWYNPESGDSDSGAGVALTKGSVAEFYRFKGFTSLVYSTASYHSHSVSRDGTILAVFETDDAQTIARVRVFDLHGTRDVVEGSEYTGGGFTELRASDSVASVEALTACLIPFREVEPSLLPYTLADAVPVEQNTSDNTLSFSSLSTLRFTITGTLLDIDKVSCEDGVTAKYEHSRDDCFESVIVVDDPETNLLRSQLVSLWNAGPAVKGLVRGAFYGEDGSRTFTGIGNPDAPLGTIKQPSLSIADNGNGTFSINGALGDITLGSCLEYNELGQVVESSGCAESCSKYYTASTTCGQSASLERDSDGSVTISCSTCSGDDLSVGDILVASGGDGNYTWSFDSGTIAADGEVLSIDACGASGTLRMGTVSVVDGCGVEGDQEYRLPGGSWVYTGVDEGCYPPGAGNRGPYYLYSGSERRRAYYQNNCATFPTGIGSSLCASSCTRSVLIDGSQVCNSCQEWKCSSCNVGGVEGGYRTGFDSIWHEYHIYVDEWRCP